RWPGNSSDMRWLWLTVLASALNAADCPAPVDQKLDLPGRPFKLAVAADGCSIFASIIGQEKGEESGIAFIRNENGALKLARTVPHKPAPTGIVLTHDGRTLLATAGEGIVLLDVARIGKGVKNPAIGTVKTQNAAGSVYVNVTGDDAIA